jgi:hypothetical protein
MSNNKIELKEKKRIIYIKKILVNSGFWEGL